MISTFSEKTCAFLWQMSFPDERNRSHYQTNDNTAQRQKQRSRIADWAIDVNLISTETRSVHEVDEIVFWGKVE